MKTLKLLSIVLIMSACSETEDSNTFDLQGHRGCRGLYPENTIPAFLHAIDLGVTTLEMDLAVTKDGQLVVSHEPYMSAEICLDSAGNEISDSLQYQYNMYEMTFQEVSAFDCGSKPHPRFPKQSNIKTIKPLLEEVIRTVKSYPDKNKVFNIYYNIEIKSQPKYDGIYHPAPAEFSELVYKAVSRNLDWSYVTIQSFDFRVLQYFHEHYPEVTLAQLIENKNSLDQNLEDLGFKPDIYSCDFTLLSRESVQHLQELEIKVIPWTVNEKGDMKRLINWGVDGLITDYPNRYNELSDE